MFVEVPGTILWRLRSLAICNGLLYMKILIYLSHTHMLSGTLRSRVATREPRLCVSERELLYECGPQKTRGDSIFFASIFPSFVFSVCFCPSSTINIYIVTDYRAHVRGRVCVYTSIFDPSLASSPSVCFCGIDLLHCGRRLAGRRSSTK